MLLQPVLLYEFGIWHITEAFAPTRVGCVKRALPPAFQSVLMEPVPVLPHTESAEQPAESGPWDS